MPNSRMTIAGLPNVLDVDVVDITAGSEGTDMLADNLKDWLHPTVLSELIGVNTAGGVTILPPHKTYWEVSFGSEPIALVKALGLGEHATLVPGEQIRVIGVNGGSLPSIRTSEIVVDNIDDNSNLNSTDVTRIDEGIEAVDGARIALNGPSTEGFMLLSYGGAPASAPAVGEQYQCFTVYVAKSHTPTTPEDFGKITCTLYEAGSPVQVLGTKIISGSSCYFFPWDAGLLADPTCADMQLRIDIYDPDPGNAVRIDCAPWQMLSQSDVNDCDADTGWMTIPGDEQESDFGNTSLEQVDILPSVTVHYLDTAVSLTKARIEIRADGVGYFNSFLKGAPRDPARFIDAGYAIVHPVWQAPFQFSDSAELNTLPTFVGEEQAIDGSSHKVLQYERRVFKVQFEFMAKSKADALFKRLNRAGTDKALLISLFPDNTVESGDLYTMLCTAQDLSPHVMTNYSRDGERTSHTFDCTFIEHLG